MSKEYILTPYQALTLVRVMDDNLKRADFKDFRRLGVDFAGYTDRMGQSRSGCSKVDCMTSIVKYLMGESLGPCPAEVAKWLDAKVPDWKESIGYKRAPLTESNIIIDPSYETKPLEPIVFDCKVCERCLKPMTAKEYWDHDCEAVI